MRISEPAEAGLFVGREAELASLSASFAGGARCVVVTGPPGIGKSRLAARFLELEATQLRSPLTCDGSSIDGAESLIAALAAALGLQGGASGPPDAGRVAAALDGVPGVVLIDDADRLEGPAQIELARLLAAAPGARLVLTSRRRTGWTGSSILDLAGLAGGEALFAAHARAAGAVLAAADRSVVASIVDALDHNPLAIQVAAAQTAVLAPGEVLARLARRLDLASDGGSSRFPTLRAAIAASWDALEPDLQGALAALGTFERDFGADAAEAILAMPDQGALHALRRLRDRSLIAVRRPADSAGDARSKLHLDASVRAFARERLAERPDRLAIEARRVGWFLPRAEEAADALRRRGARSGREWLHGAESDLHEMARTGDRDASIRAAMALAVLWQRTGRMGELASLLDGLAARGCAPRSRDEEITLTIARAQALGLRGDLVAGRDLLDREVARLDQAPCRDDLAGEMLTHLLVRWRQTGAVDDAIAAGRRAQQLLADADAPQLRAANLACLGLTLAEVGRAEEARACDQDARDAFAALDDRWGEGLALGNLAQLDQGAGDLDAASFLIESALEAFRDARDPLYLAVYGGVRAGILRERGALDEALAAYEAAVERLAASGARHVEGIFRAQRGGLLAAVGRLAEARCELDAAGVLLRAASSPAYLEMLHLHARELEIAATAAPTAPDGERRRAAALDAARVALQAVPRLSLERRSQFVDLAARCLARSLGPQPTARDVLTVGPDATWFERAGAPPVSLERRAAPRRILGALLAAHPAGGPLDVDALFAAGWPGERALPAAMANRVRVAVATLRGLGLEELLVTIEGGYALARGLRLEHRAGPATIGPG